jgi:hypothetical protein
VSIRIRRATKRSLVAAAIGAQAIINVVGIAGLPEDAPLFLQWIEAAYPAGGWVFFIAMIYWIFWIGGDEVAEARKLEAAQRIASLEKQNAALEAAVSKREAKRLDVLMLSELWEQGSGFSAQRVTMDKFSAWEADVEKWELVTLAVLKTKFSHQTAIAFKFVKFNPNENFVYKISDAHNADLQQLVARCRILSDILCQYKEYWSPMTGAERVALRAGLAIFEAHASATHSRKELEPERR